jgi:Fe-S-cluster containining protein
VTCTKESGTCATCRQACAHKPGWFLPGEAELAAELMGLPLAEFFARFLAVDWWVADHRIDRTTFVLSPAIAGEEAGAEFPGEPRGECVFYKDQRCQIHAAKPFECREHWCGNHDPGSPHEDAARAWTAHQDQIGALLGRDPEAEAYEGGSLFGSLLGGW